MRVQLTRKLADQLDGIDVSTYSVGDTLELTRHEAELLVAEGWAERCLKPVLAFPNAAEREWRSTRSAAAAADSSDRVLRILERLREARVLMEQRRVVEEERRRAEDRLRDEIHDARSRIVLRTG